MVGCSLVECGAWIGIGGVFVELGVCGGLGLLVGEVCGPPPLDLAALKKYQVGLAWRDWKIISPVDIMDSACICCLLRRSSRASHIWLDRDSACILLMLSNCMILSVTA